MCGKLKWTLVMFLIGFLTFLLEPETWFPTLFLTGFVFLMGFVFVFVFMFLVHECERERAPPLGHQRNPID